MEGENNKIETFDNVTFTILGFQSKNHWSCKESGKCDPQPRKKSMKTGKEMTGMVELAERNFQRAIINRLSDLKKNLNIVKRNVENV